MSLDQRTSYLYGPTCPQWAKPAPSHPVWRGQARVDGAKGNLSDTDGTNIRAIEPSLYIACADRPVSWYQITELLHDGYLLRARMPSRTMNAICGMSETRPGISIQVCAMLKQPHESARVDIGRRGGVHGKYSTG